MYGNAKNTANYLAKSETLRNIALPNKRVNAYTKYIANTFWTYPCSASTLRRCACLATKGGTSSLYIYLTKLLTNKCQTRSKVAIPRITVTGLHLLHLLISYQSHSLSKKLANLFAELKTLCIFVSARMIYEGTAIIARFPRTYLVCRSCQRLGASLPFIHTLINFCFAKWQERTKVSTRSTVRSLHLVPKVRNHSNSLQKSNLLSCWRVTLPNLSRQKAYTVAPYPCSVSGAMMSLKATTHRCTNSLQSSML